MPEPTTTTETAEQHDCECGTPIPGLFWPCASDGDDSRDWVERCDICARFPDDETAAVALAEHLGAEVQWGLIEPTTHTEGSGDNPYRRQPYVPHPQNAGAERSEPIECRYSAAHRYQGIPATEVLDCGRVGWVPACKACADFYSSVA